MINYLKNYLAKNYFDGLSQNNIHIVKTQNGLAHINKKIVFYVFREEQTKPALLIYASRHVSVNNILQQSADASKYKLAPKIFFEDKYNEILFIGVEYVKGQPFILGDKKHLVIAFDYLKDLPKENNKTINEFYQDIKNKFNQLDLKIPKAVDNLVEQFANYKIPVIKQHGDFQDNNLYIVDNKLKIIDWDDYGQIDFAFFDFLTLYLKYQKKHGEDEFIKNKWSTFVDDSIDSKILILFYKLYNFLRKDKLHNKFERKKHIDKLKKDLKNLSN